MRDTWGRTIDYLRLSLTDRCNLRCEYCLPQPLPAVSHTQILRYKEILTICRVAISLGITRFKVTGGEPLVRKGAVSFLEAMKQLPGITSLTLTSNGLLVAPVAKKLATLGLDGLNISLDSLDARQYQQISGGGELQQVLSGLQAALAAGLFVKINAVLLPETKAQWLPLVRLAEKFPLAVRFIEMMPIGHGRDFSGPGADEVLARLRMVYPDLQATKKTYGNGPASYYTSTALQGPIGFIAANSHCFCQHCNRLRLTSTGFLKPCLCYDMGVDLRALVRQGGNVEENIRQALGRAISEKPRQHCFDKQTKITEQRGMSQIGG